MNPIAEQREQQNQKACSKHWQMEKYKSDLDEVIVNRPTNQTNESDEDQEEMETEQEEFHH